MYGLVQGAARGALGGCVSWLWGQLGLELSSCACEKWAQKKMLERYVVQASFKVQGEGFEPPTNCV